MRTHFAKGAPEPLRALPESVVEKLRKDWDGGKGKVDFAPVRKYVGAWADKNLIPGFRKQQLGRLDKAILNDERTLTQLTKDRAKLVGQ